MADKVDLLKEVETAKMEYMKIRFRLSMGEQIKSHEVTTARKKIAGAVRAANSGDKD